MVHGSTVTIDNLDSPDVLEFFQSIVSHVLPTTENGHVDIFVPLASTGKMFCHIFHQCFTPTIFNEKLFLNVYILEQVYPVSSIQIFDV